MPPLIELIPIGTELMLGRIPDTNTQYLAAQVCQQGGRIRRVSLVRDSPQDIIDVVQEAVAGGVTHIITTGGLGPTPDDMTVATLAQMLRCQTHIDKGLLGHFQEKLRLKGIEEVSDHMRKVATIPDIGTAAPNILGWGHCITIPYQSTTLFVLPGPPREVRELYPACIAPILAAAD
ncbi:MAG: hypothetical protein HOH43_02805 [Candidatus Latescibacteria bacterium]|jgi:nicotinamide-nucleotide amidase|nr:hypothetical protein [Candidatus Latescibacterota bacterium]